MLRRIALLFAVGGLLLLAWWRFFPNEEARIRKRLANLAATVSVPEKPSPAGTLLALDRLKGCFTPDVVVEFDVPIEGRHTFNDRDELIQAAAAVRNNAQNFKVEFLDVNVKLDATKEKATVELTARVNRPGDRDFYLQEFKLQLRKKDKLWRISHAETVRVFKQ